LGLITALEVGLWRSGEVATIELHLYWVFVLLQSVRRGLRLGLVVALMAAGAYAAVVVAMPNAVPTGYERLATESIFVVLVAMVTGDLRERWRGREKDLVARTAELSEALDDLSKQYMSASDVIAELGRRIAEQTVTVVTLDNIARRLEVFDPAKVFPALLQLLVVSLKVERASVYMLQDGRLVRTAHVPATEPPPAADHVVENELVRQALVSREPRHIRDQLAGSTRSGLSTSPVLLAAPLLSATGEPVGVVTVEQMAFLSFNRSAVRLFGILVAWASRSLQNALLFEQVSEHRTYADEGSPTLKLPYADPMGLSSTAGGLPADAASSRAPASAAAARIIRRHGRRHGRTRRTLLSHVTRYRWVRRLRSPDARVAPSALTDAAE
ncbi:MAG: GAF domain-containing protein, partial [Chloroflexota bacterium]|nr:GAF domain-containing protein [Chloroflexota bacterium]